MANKICIVCGGNKLPWFSKKRCKPCAQKSYSKKSAENATRTPINKISEKRKQEQKSYTVLRRLFLEANPECAAHLVGCTLIATECHHKKGRTGALYLDVRHFLAVCHSCHDFITINSKMAIDMGLSELRVS